MRLHLRKVIAVAVLSILGGCQAPIVSVRNISYVVVLNVDGKPQNLKVQYKCHYENNNWLSTRGAFWWIRSGNESASILSALADGTQFTISPKPAEWITTNTRQSDGTVWQTRHAPIGKVDSLCPENTGPIDGVPRVTRSTGVDHSFEIVESRLVIESVGLDAFKPQK